MLMIGTARTILIWMRQVIAPTTTTRSPSNQECPSCPDCGCATTRSHQDITFEIGGGKETRSEPLVHASVTMNVPVFKCTNPNCRCGLYGDGANEIMDPVKKVLMDRARLKG